MSFGLDGGFDPGFDFTGGIIPGSVVIGGGGVQIGDIPDIVLPGGVTLQTPDQITLGLGNNTAEERAVIIVNRCEYLLKDNVVQFQSGRRPRDPALIFFDQVMAQLAQACGAVGGSWGQNCFGDRTAGGKFDWVTAYRDPIARASGGGGIFGGGGGVGGGGFYGGIGLAGIAIFVLIAIVAWKELR